MAFVVQFRFRETMSSLQWCAKAREQLGELNVTIDVPRDIPLLEIPKGRVSLQRFIYWHVFKAFHHQDLSVGDLNHINFDWYAPQNAHRQTPEQVRQWCLDAGLQVDQENLHEAGITVVASKPP